MISYEVFKYGTYIPKIESKKSNFVEEWHNDLRSGTLNFEFKLFAIL